MRGSSHAYERSTSRFATTNISARKRIHPSTTGRSRTLMASTVARPSPGHANTVSVRITSYNVCYTKLLLSPPFLNSPQIPFHALDVVFLTLSQSPEKKEPTFEKAHFIFSHASENLLPKYSPIPLNIPLMLSHSRNNFV